MSAPGEGAGVLLHGYGLAIRSVIPLPGAVSAAGEGTADVEIAYGTAPRALPYRAGPYSAASADLFAFKMAGLARFACIDRRRVLVDPAPRADADAIGAMLVATVLPALLWARGRIVLHACAFVLPGATRAIAVAGASGSGKSTALARALAMGARAIGDDSIVVDARGGLCVAGLAGGYFERSGDTRVFHAIADTDPRAWPLGAIVVLAPDALPQRLTGTDALAALLRHRHRPRIATLLGTEPALLPAIATLARTVPIIRVWHANTCAI